MAENTKIEWCDHTFNPWIGCAKIHTGCKFCYAENQMATRYHRVVWGEDGTRSRTKTWGDPVRWNREAGVAGGQRKVFCASLADIFEDRADLEPWRQELFELIDRCQNLRWLLLTKRPENIRSIWPGGQYRANVWLGTSISEQPTADKWVDRLLLNRNLTPTLFLSMEPQVGPVNLSRWLLPNPLVDWVIVGGESKQGDGQPRRFNLEWAFATLEECACAGVPCFVKQVGANPFHNGQWLRLKDWKAGADMNEWPEALRVRECPESFAVVI